MGAYDEIEVEDMTWNEELQAYTYSCPCGDLFHITLEELRQGEDVARCPSCSLYITVVYNPEDFTPPPAPGSASTPAAAGQQVAVA